MRFFFGKNRSGAKRRTRAKPPVLSNVDRETALQILFERERREGMRQLRELQEQLRNGEISEDEFDDAYDLLMTEPGMQDRFLSDEPH